MRIHLLSLNLRSFISFHIRPLVQLNMHPGSLYLRLSTCTPLFLCLLIQDLPNSPANLHLCLFTPTYLLPALLSSLSFLFTHFTFMPFLFPFSLFPLVQISRLTCEADLSLP
jgi:hypothetical protein